ncbi:hypothetical protein SNEBB_007855 [Seison nebaliae]|nr:hypothetical protein SNEBB_007855 [Seison nebaliae]
MEEEPISSICFVTQSNPRFADYQILTHAFDDSTMNANLWDGTGIFSTKYRYLAFSRQGAKDNMNVVITNILITSMDKNTPTEFTHLENTKDTEEKCLKKKKICFKLDQRRNVERAISDIIILGRTKKPPNGYRIIGDINNLIICSRESNIQKKKPDAPIATNYDRSTSINRAAQFRSPIKDIPMRLNEQYLSSNKTNATHPLLNEMRTKEDILQKYNYEFQKERDCKNSFLT